eukprot:TRINITY_DN4415_c0_g1_i1.p2 TRINITY_DN4415_c0_g1~~TRINITY_DN4415_c0_g1_i1.p2  ORF type:complete len:54 (-),score=13.11 TRINITY_DN4415_c0_g1_i1:2-163(-)
MLRKYILRSVAAVKTFGIVILDSPFHISLGGFRSRPGGRLPGRSSETAKAHRG